MAGPPQPSQGDGDNEGDRGDPDSQRWCVEEPCRRRPFFGAPGGKPMYCAQHSKSRAGMVDVSSRRCEAVGCAKWPLYGNEGEKAKFCSIHKSAAMIDVRSRRCAAPECKRQPSYGFEGKRACFCAAHKLEGQVDVVSRRCEKPNCRRRPLYGYEGQKSQFCSAHKQEGQVDVCNRRCQRAGCSKRPCFGLPGQRPSFCGTHRSPEMVDVISHKCAYRTCSHPTGYEANRVRSKFCDKHKSVGLAGASLLQLASAATEDSSTSSTAGTEQSPANKPTPSGGQVGGLRNINDINPGVIAFPGGAHSQGLASEPMYPPVAESPRRRATLHAPVASTFSEDPIRDPRDMPKRRASMPIPRLPSVRSLLKDIPRSRLKRHREESPGGTYDVDNADSASSSSLPAQHPRSNPEAVGFLRSGHNVVGICSGDGHEQGSGGGGGDDGGGCGGSDDCNGDGGAGKSDRRGGSSAGSEAMDVESRGRASTVGAAPARSRPPNKTSRLFAGPSTPSGQQDGGGATQQQNVWNPHLVPAPTGYVTSSPAPEWRRVGLSSLGRAASYDEARAAASRNGLAPQDSSKPRRASAFVSNLSALPPVVTEIRRRDSAFESRATPTVPSATHYSELLSAKAPSRSVTAFNGRHRFSSSLVLRHPDARIEEEDSNAAGSPGSMPLWKNGLFPGPGAAAAGDDGARTARTFHVMPATAVFSAGLSSRSPRAVPTVSTAAPGAHGGGGRRWSVVDQPPSGPPEKDVGGSTTMFVPAWGAPVDDGRYDGEGVSDRASAGEGREDFHRRTSNESAGDGSRGVSGSGDVGDYQSPNPPRRGSMMAPAASTGRLASQACRWPAAGASDHDRGIAGGAKALVPAWGAKSEESLAEKLPARPADGGDSGRAGARRAGVLFGRGEGGDGCGGPSQSENGGQQLSTRSDLSSVAVQAGGSEGPGGLAPRRNSMMAPVAPLGRLDHHGPSSFVRSSWGAPPASRRGSVSTPGLAMASQRRGSVSTRMGATPQSGEELPAAQEDAEMHRQQGSITPEHPGERSGDAGGSPAAFEGHRQLQRLQQHQQLQHQQHQHHQQRQSEPQQGSFVEGRSK